MSEPADESAEWSLPESVRLKVVALAADALGRMTEADIPTGLRRVASFAPRRRATLAAAQIAAALGSDAGFRARVADQVRTELPALAGSLADGTVPDVAEPGDVAAAAYLLRPRGWQELVARCLDALEVEREHSSQGEATDRVVDLEQRLAEASDRLREVRARHREELTAMKAENADLRRRLGETRNRERTAVAAAESERSRARDEVARAELRAGEQAAEVRRIRARLDQLESEYAEVRRTGRAERSSGTLRARLLLDTLLDSARGLSRELALPPAPGTPADGVAAHLAEDGSVVSSRHGSLAADDPTLLAELLSLPRAHLIVDGYNVTKSTWPDLTLEQQRGRLLTDLGPVAARSGAEVTVVFDAGATASRPVVQRPRSVRVLFSPAGVIADDVIRDLVAAEPDGRPVVVVTSDQAVANDVVADGARTVAASALSRLLARS